MCHFWDRFELLLLQPGLGNDHVTVDDRNGCVFCNFDAARKGPSVQNVLKKLNQIIGSLFGSVDKRKGTKITAVA